MSKSVFCANDSIVPLARFEENKGQWHTNVKFKTEIVNGALFFENNGITTVFTNLNDVSEKAHHSQPIENENLMVKEEAFRTYFVGSNPNVSISKKGGSSYYRNYFIGNDKTKWASNVLLYDEIIYENLYDGIDLRYSSNSLNIKYDVLIHVGANPNSYKVSYESHKKLFCDKAGNLICANSLGEIIEQKPYSYQIINGKKIEVKTQFNVENNIVSFDFPDGYNSNYDLIIDPFLVASTYSGALTDNWGNTACPGPGGSMRVAGSSFGVGYPTSLGAFDVSFNGAMDISISAFNATGTALIASTYVGGLLIEEPLSLITALNGDLLVVGVSRSVDFPTTATGYDLTHNGNRDMVVFRLNPTFTTLLASTYVGGTGNDAYNFTATSDTKFSYADENRSQIRIDNTGNVVIASSSASIDFPITAGVINPIHNGGLDGVVIKLDPNLTTLLFSTYLGGLANEACTSLQLDIANNIYVCGLTSSANFPTTAGVIHPIINGGSDGFLSVIDPTGTTLIASTYLGTANKDGAMYVDLDVSGNVFVYGLSSGGSYPVTMGAYANAGSSQFIHSLNPSLTTTLFSTVFGSGGASPNISPTAFEVDTCGNVYACGWGRAFDGGTSTGMVTSPGAFSSVTDGSDFYFIVLDRSGSTLLYSTFFGQFGGTADHVDGGTSLFDDQGVVYQAVCASCGGSPAGFPITPGAYSATNNSANCNNAVFKFDLEIHSPPIAVITASNVGCVNIANTFTNSSTNATVYFWDFGDGTTSSSTTPVHTYTASGSYTITLIAQNYNLCISKDTTTSVINIYQPTVSVTSSSICIGQTATLTASGGSTYLWDNSSITSTISVSPIVTQVYTVQSVDSHNCYSIPTTATVLVNSLPSLSVNSPTVCPNTTAVLTASGVVSYTWGIGSSLNPITVGVLSNDSLFTVQGTDLNGCVSSLTSTVHVFNIPPVAATSASVCMGLPAVLTANGASNYLWSNGVLSNSITISTLVNSTFTVIGTDINLCVSTATASITILPLPVAAGTTTLTAGCPTLCVDFSGVTAPGTTSITSWSWNFGNGSTSSIQNPSVCFNSSGMYTVGVSVLDVNGCYSLTNNTLTINVYPQPTAAFNSPEFVSILEPTVNFTNTSIDFINSSWIFGDYINQTNNSSNLLNPSHTYSEIGPYCIELTVDNAYGCLNTTTHCVEVKPEFAFYIPNCFTPERADGINDIFTGMGIGIAKYEMWIFNRWGDKIFYTNDINVGWDGKMTGKPNYVQQDVYVWKVKLTDVFGDKHSYVGHVTVLK